MQSSTGLWEALFCLYPFYCQCEDDTETIIIIYFPSVIFKSSQFNCVKITICSPQKVTKMVSFRAFFFFLSSHRERKTKPQQQFMHQGHISSHMNFSHIFVITSEHNGTLKYLKLESTFWLWPGTGATAVHCWTLPYAYLFSFVLIYWSAQR